MKGQYRLQVEHYLPGLKGEINRMLEILFSVFGIGFCISFANGANDVSKSIATLVGSGIADYRRAIAWGTLWTAFGAVVAAFVTRAMLQTFGSISRSSTIHPLSTAIATIVGTILWIAIATYASLPVSTTHAIVGSLTGVALFNGGFAQVNWSVLTGKIAVPMLLSPIVAFGLTISILKLWRNFAPEATEGCICLDKQDDLKLLSTEAALATSVAVPVRFATCDAANRSSAGLTVGHLHWLSSGFASFFRALNDTPKMVALLLGAALVAGGTPPLSGSCYAVVALGMTAGSWIAGRRVTHQLARKVTPMDHREGFAANLVTAALVGIGAPLGLPMSTTHVATGAILGIAAEQQMPANRKVIAEMIIAWIVTLPAAALLSVLVLVALDRTMLFAR